MTCRRRSAKMVGDDLGFGSVSAGEKTEVVPMSSEQLQQTDRTYTSSTLLFTPRTAVGSSNPGASESQRKSLARRGGLIYRRQSRLHLAPSVGACVKSNHRPVSLVREPQEESCGPRPSIKVRRRPEAESQSSALLRALVARLWTR